MTPHPDSDVAVIGAGISGLACAYLLQCAGLRVTVFERDARPGGVIASVSRDGFLSECGPNSTLDGKDAFDAIVSDLGLRERLAVASDEAKKRFILRGGALHPLPMSPPALLGSRLFSARGKARLLREPFVRPSAGGGEESVGAFVRRRFGPEAADYAAGPFVAGVYAGDPERLSMGAAFPAVVDYERVHGSVIKGAIRAMRERRRTGKARPRLVSFDGGMEVLVTSLAGALAPRLRLSTPVTALARAGDGWEVAAEGAGTLRARAVVVTTPADVTAGLVSGLDPALSSRLREVPYAPVVSVYIGAPRERVAHPLDGFGFLVPEVEDGRILGTIFNSSLFGGRAPRGMVALTTFVGGMRQPDLADLDDRAVVELVREELGRRIGLSGEPACVRVRAWRRAIPQYALGHGGLVAALGALEERTPGLHFGSNFVGGVSVGDCVETAARVSRAVAKRLGPAA
ncbi:MAG: protoporphyrinogen oxidase [Candidatus Krumholzibacteria bacterium]|nr:protoporphyrinogen oxidase [Candidatus Krumholzibacteria bacterium]